MITILLRYATMQKGGFEVVAGSAQTAIDGFGSVGEAAAGAKKAKGSLAGFDEINNISLPESGGGGGAAEAAIGGTGAVADMSTAPQITDAAPGAAAFDGMASSLGKLKDTIAPALAEL